MSKTSIKDIFLTDDEKELNVIRESDPKELLTSLIGCSNRQGGKPLNIPNGKTIKTSIALPDSIAETIDTLKVMALQVKPPVEGRAEALDKLISTRISFDGSICFNHDGMELHYQRGKLSRLCFNVEDHGHNYWYASNNVGPCRESEILTLWQVIRHGTPLPNNIAFEYEVRDGVLVSVKEIDSALVIASGEFRTFKRWLTGNQGGWYDGYHVIANMAALESFTAQSKRLNKALAVTL